MDLTINLVESMLSSPFCLFLCLCSSPPSLSSPFYFCFRVPFNLNLFFFLGLCIREAFKWCVPVPNNIMYRFLTYTCLFILFVTTSLIIGTHFLSASTIIYKIQVSIIQKKKLEIKFITKLFVKSIL